MLVASARKQIERDAGERERKDSLLARTFLLLSRRRCHAREGRSIAKLSKVLSLLVRKERGTAKRKAEPEPRFALLLCRYIVQYYSILLHRYRGRKRIYFICRLNPFSPFGGGHLHQG